MITFSIVQKSQLEGASRLDAEYYQPEFLEVREHLQSIPHLVLGDYAFVTDGEHGSVEFEGDGIKYLTAENVTEGFLKLDDIRYVSEKVDKRNRRATLQSGDVTLSIKGTVGLAAIVFSNDLPANMNRDVSRIHIKDEIDPYFLTVFLNSKFGKNQTLRESSGNVQQMITLSRIRELLVPKLAHDFISQIKDKYLECYELLQKSKLDYLNAENLLLEELGLADFQIPDDLAFEVNFSEVKNAGRMDADYFQPKYEELVKRIKEHEAKKLGEIVSLKKGIEPGSEAYRDEGKLFIRVSSLSKNGIEQKDQKYLSEDLYQQLKSTYEPKVGEILLTKDATPGIAYVVKESVEGIVSGGILRLKPKVDIDAEYLALYINSTVGQMQIEQSLGGSIIEHWKPEHVRELLIPILSPKIQQELGDFIRTSHEARKKSKELLEEAKRKVEEMIEKGGENNG